MSHNQKVLLNNSSHWAIYNGFTTVYLTAFAIALGASNIVVGLISALPFIAAIFTQIIGATIVRNHSRKTIYLIFATIGRLTWIPILLAPYLLTEPLIFVVAFYLTSRLAEYLTEPAYGSILGDVVSEKHRGEFLSQRFKLMGLWGMIAITLGGLWLEQFPKESPHGFAILFTVGILFGLLANKAFAKLKEPKNEEHEYYTVKQFFTLTGKLKTFVIFSLVYNFGFMLSSPLFTVYYLENLQMSYEYYGIVIGIFTLSQILCARYIGKITDKYGDKPVAIIGVIGTAAVPLMILGITQNNMWLMIPFQIFSGFMWTLSDIARLNLLIDVTEPKKRAMQVAEYTFYSSITLAIAPIIGGWISEHPALIAGLPFVFILSALIRGIAVFFLMPIKEPRAKKEYGAVYVFKQITHIHPDRGIDTATKVIKRIATGIGLVK